MFRRAAVADTVLTIGGTAVNVAYLLTCSLRSNFETLCRCFLAACVDVAQAFFAADFATPALFAPSAVACAPAFFSRHRFFRAATIAALPAALSLRFGREGLGVPDVAADSDSPRILAHRRCWPSLIRFLAAALIFLRLPLRSFCMPTDSTRPTGSIARSSAICASIRVF